IGISAGVELDKVRKRHIGPAAEELVDAGFLKPASAEERFQKVRRGVWSAVFDLAAEAKEPTHRIVAAQEPLISALERRGISAAGARRLAAEGPKETLIRALMAMDEQRAAGTLIRAPERWLTKAI